MQQTTIIEKDNNANNKEGTEEEEALDPRFPLEMQGVVTKGFGRGSKELGIPTANLPEDVSEQVSAGLETGIYFGFAQVASGPVYPMVMSYGWNPFYKNEKRSAEVHIIYNFPKDFYGEQLKVLVLGWIRPELNYTTLEALIEAINNDIKVAVSSLQRPAYSTLATHSLFSPSTNS